MSLLIIRSIQEMPGLMASCGCLPGTMLKSTEPLKLSVAPFGSVCRMIVTGWFLVNSPVATLPAYL